MLGLNKNGYFPYTPSTNLLYGLREAINMLIEEGLENVYARHDVFSEATRRCVRTWGLELQCLDNSAHSSTVTTVRMPEGHSADRFRSMVLDNFNMSLGSGAETIENDDVGWRDCSVFNGGRLW